MSTLLLAIKASQKEKHASVLNGGVVIGGTAKEHKQMRNLTQAILKELGKRGKKLEQTNPEEIEEIILTLLTTC